MLSPLLAGRYFDSPTPDTHTRIRIDSFVASQVNPFTKALPTRFGTSIFAVGLTSMGRERELEIAIVSWRTRAEFCYAIGYRPFVSSFAALSINLSSPMIWQ